MSDATNARQLRRRSRLFALAEVAMCVVDDAGIVLDANSAFERATGHSARDSIGRAFVELVSDDRPVMVGATTFRPGARAVFESRRTRGDGSVVRLRWNLLHDGGERVTFAIAADVAERRRAEAERSKFKLGIDRSNDAVMVTARDGTIEYVNEAFEALYGFHRDEAIGQTPRILKSGLMDAGEYAAIWHALLSKNVVALPMVNKAKDGRLLQIEASMNPILDGDGEILGFLAIHRDVTERERAARERESLAEQLRRSQKMEAIGALAGGVAHDFNNLLSVILGEAEMLRADFASGDRRCGGIDEIRTAAKRAAELTRQLLAFSRSPVRKTKLLDLGQTLRGTERMLRRLIGADVDLATTVAPELWSVRADEGQIEQVVINLAVNARDAMPDGGRLTIELANVEVDGARARANPGLHHGPHVALTMTDTGVGMDAETQARMFEPFFTRKDRGTGLGLATVLGIVTQSGGHIEVHSDLGVGTTFRIYLPAVPGVVAEPASEPPPPRTLRGSETILLVEDDDRLREVVNRILRRSGYLVLEAANGRAASVRCSEHVGPIHLLLTDVVLPRMSGRELARRVCHERPGIEVLFMSGYLDHAVLAHDVDDAGVAFLQKPFTPEALLRAVRELLGST